MPTVIDTGTTDLLAELHDDGVLVATLNRPDTRNAFSGAMGRALGELYARADVDDAVRVVVLTGTPPAFCAGADFSGGSEVFERSESTAFSANPVWPPAWRIRKPVIAAVNGHAIGIGFTLTLHCDIRFMGELNRSSQHLMTMEVCGGATATVGRQGASPGDAVAGAAGPSSSCGARVLASDRSGQEHRGRCSRDRGVGPCRVALVPSRWRDAACEPRRTDRPVSVFR
jgi:enoyl-CoA hydratase/carnithine racemase